MSKLSKIKYLSIYLFLILGGIISFSFVKKEQAKQTCKYIAIDIDYSNNTFFINEQTVLNQLTHYMPSSIVGKPLKTVNLAAIERVIEQNPYVYKASAFMHLNCTLRVVVQQRTPMIRVLNAFHESFYIDKNGLKMPFAQASTHHLPVITGFVAERLRTTSDTLETKAMKQALLLNQYFEANEWVKSLFTQIYINNLNEFELIPRLGSHAVILGEIADYPDLEEKFYKLDLLYKTGFEPEDWQRYETVNLKFKGQIVCKKKYHHE